VRGADSHSGGGAIVLAATGGSGHGTAARGGSDHVWA